MLAIAISSSSSSSSSRIISSSSSSSSSGSSINSSIVDGDCGHRVRPGSIYMESKAFRARGAWRFPSCRSYAPTETWTVTANSCAGCRMLCITLRCPHCAVHILRCRRAAAVATPTQTNRNPITVEAVTVILCEPWLRSSTHACPAGYVSQTVGTVR